MFLILANMSINQQLVKNVKNDLVLFVLDFQSKGTNWGRIKGENGRSQKIPVQAEQ